MSQITDVTYVTDAMSDRAGVLPVIVPIRPRCPFKHRVVDSDIWLFCNLREGHKGKHDTLGR